MYKTILAVIVSQLVGTNAYACAAWVQGLSAEELGSVLERVATRVEDQNKSEFQVVKRIHWPSVNTMVGLEGDCNAITVAARFNMETEKDGKSCLVSAEVSYVESTREIPAFFEQRNKTVSCM